MSIIDSEFLHGFAAKSHLVTRSTGSRCMRFPAALINNLPFSPSSFLVAFRKLFSVPHTLVTRLLNRHGPTNGFNMASGRFFDSRTRSKTHGSANIVPTRHASKRVLVTRPTDHVINNDNTQSHKYYECGIYNRYRLANNECR